jgi:hypothetical protein
VEVRFERKVRVGAMEIFETFNAGAVKCVQLRDPNGEWHTVYTAARIESIDKLRRFVPQIERPIWKTNEMRIDIDQPADRGAEEWQNLVQLDAVALYGYEHDEHMPSELAEPDRLLTDYYANRPMYDDEADQDEETRQLLVVLQSASVSVAYYICV